MPNAIKKMKSEFILLNFSGSFRIIDSSLPTIRHIKSVAKKNTIVLKKIFILLFDVLFFSFLFIFDAPNLFLIILVYQISI